MEESNDITQQLKKVQGNNDELLKRFIIFFLFPLFFYSWNKIFIRCLEDEEKIKSIPNLKKQIETYRKNLTESELTISSLNKKVTSYEVNNSLFNFRESNSIFILLLFLQRSMSII